MGETVLVTNGLPATVRAGEVIGGKYRLERELGRGAMGTVWAAQHLTLGQRVAIKLISAEHAGSPEARTRFGIEAKAAARLKSRHVVQVYDDGETPEGMPYIVMEYLEGETLESRLEREREIPLLDAVRITGQVGRALARAHARGIVHRDLKPANIFLARNDEDELGWTTKVLDFGIAKLEESTSQSTTKTGTVLGTPLFMSPEQVRGAHRVDARSDLYSLGACFFNMVTGRFPFEGESFGDILVSICTAPLPDLKVAAPTLPASVAAWFQRCCAREAAQRFQSADELVDALQKAVGDSATLAQRGAVPEDQRGPYGTLRGHAAPIGPATRALSTNDSGPFPLLDAASASASSELSGSHSASVLTVRDLPLRSGTPRALWVAGAALCAIAAVTLVLTLRRAPESTQPSALTTAAGATSTRSDLGPPASPAPIPPAPAEAPAQVATAPATPEAAASAASPAQPALTAAAKAAPANPRRPPPRTARPVARKHSASTDLGF